jgi:hypothetical protein
MDTLRDKKVVGVFVRFRALHQQNSDVWVVLPSPACNTLHGVWSCGVAGRAGSGFEVHHVVDCGGDFITMLGQISSTSSRDMHLPLPSTRCAFGAFSDAEN